MRRFLLPLLLFLALAATLALALRHNADAGDPTALPSPLLRQPLPALDMAVLTGTHASTRFQPQQLQGQVWLLNVWASWCTSCLREHPLLMAQAQAAQVPLVGFNYQDQADKGLAWLRRHGNPYTLTVVDDTGRAGLDLGIIAVPETFVIDRRGHVAYKVSGPISEALWRDTLQPLIRKLQDA